MRIATQNLNWGGEPDAPGCDGEPRLKRLVACLARIEADLLVLTEFKSGVFGYELRELLANGGFPYFSSHKQQPFSLGTAIASRRPLTVVELPIPSVIDPWRSIGVEVDGLKIFGFYFPLEDSKPPYWDWLLANAEKLRDSEVILVGDFNTGKHRIDEAGETLDCHEKHVALEDLGFVDTWRAAYPKGRDYTWYSSYGNGFRLDYIWASAALARRISRAWHDHEPRLTLSSDHSVVVVDLSTHEETSTTKLPASPDRSGALKNLPEVQEAHGAENKFTAAWSFVLGQDLALAQAVANILLKDRNLVAKVIRVTDHPKLNSSKQPDFHIECDVLDILVEHKLEALLHDKQLENYHELALDSPHTYVALIAPSYQPVPPDVLDIAQSPRYLKPEGRAHFRWSDFHDAVRSRPGKTSQELADLMTSLGMAPFTLKGTEDIFNKGVKPVQFEANLKLASTQIFVTINKGCRHKTTPTGLGREVRNPLASISLIYIWAEQRSSCIDDCYYPVLAVNVFERDLSGSPLLGHGRITTVSGIVVRRYLLEIEDQWEMGEGTCRITYVAQLDKIIHDTQDETVRCMAEVLAVVRSDWPEDLDQSN